MTGITRWCSFVYAIKVVKQDECQGTFQAFWLCIYTCCPITYTTGPLIFSRRIVPCTALVKSECSSLSFVPAWQGPPREQTSAAEEETNTVMTLHCCLITHQQRNDRYSEAWGHNNEKFFFSLEVLLVWMGWMQNWALASGFAKHVHRST